MMLIRKLGIVVGLGLALTGGLVAASMDRDERDAGCCGRLWHRSQPRYLGVELKSQEEYDTLYARSEPKPGAYRHVYLPQDRIRDYIDQWKKDGITIRKDRKIELWAPHGTSYGRVTQPKPLPSPTLWERWEDWRRSDAPTFLERYQAWGQKGKSWFSHNKRSGGK